MIKSFDIKDWFWIVAGDESRAWSSAANAYVADYPRNAFTRIESEDSLTDVLRLASLRGPRVTIDDVRSEAQRRIVLTFGATDLNGCLIKQLNANMLANELSDIRFTRALTPSEEATATALRNLASKIKAIRAASNVLEAAPPADYRDNRHWPV